MPKIIVKTEQKNNSHNSCLQYLPLYYWTAAECLLWMSQLVSETGCEATKSENTWIEQKPIVNYCMCKVLPKFLLLTVQTSYLQKHFFNIIT